MYQNVQMLNALWRHAEVVRVGVPEEVVAAAKLLLDARHRRTESRVARVDEPDLGHQQQARIQPVAFEALREGAEVGVPGPLQDGLSHHLRAPPPPRAAFGFTEMSGDLREPVARGPAHQARRRVHPGHGAQLPHAGIGLIVHGERALADPFEAFELDPPGFARSRVSKNAWDAASTALP